MDFTQELLMFQGSLTSADNVHKFSKITSKGGNEEKVAVVIQNVKRFLQMERYTDENGLIEAKVTITRKFAMYLVLNADLPVLQDMMDITEIEPIIWTIPTLPKYLLCEMIWQFHMGKFIYELIPNCWPQLGLEVAEAFVENFKYLNPTECLDRLYKLSLACYGLICSITYFKLEDNIVSELLNSVYGVLEKFLKYFVDPPNKYKLDRLNDDELYKYKGNRFRSILFLVFDCCTMFSENLNLSCVDPIYRLTYNEGYLQHTTCKPCDSPNKLVVECLQNTNIFLLDIFKEIVMDISVDIFCAWSEYEEDGKTVQQTIGELCDKIHKKLQSVSSLCEHPVLGMIELMARKPTNINDIINSTDTDIIIQKINSNDEESSSWIHALVKKQNLSQDLKLIEIVKSNLNVFDEKECVLLHNALTDATVDEPDHHELLNSLKINLFNKCNTTDKLKLLKDHYRDKIFTNTILSREDYECKLNEMFNKFIADTNVEFADVLTAFYQSPKSVFIKIFTTAVQNSKLIESMLKLMKLLEDFMEHYYAHDSEPCVITIMKSMPDLQSFDKNNKDNYVKFVCKLKNENLISSSRLLMTVIMANMHAGLIDDNFKKMNIQVQLLTEAYTMSELSQYRAPMLVMMGQVMESARCRDFDKFQVDAVETLEVTLSFQQSLINSYNNVFPETDSAWLKFKLNELSMHPMNSYYFRAVSNSNSDHYFEYVTELHVHRKANLNEVAARLTQILPWSVLQEWCAIWDSFILAGLKEKHVLHLFHSVIDELNNFIETKRSPNSLSCLFYCYTNLMHIIRYKFLQESLTNSKVKTCANLLSLNLSRANTEDAPEITSIISPLLGYLASRRNEFTVNFSQYFANNHYYSIVDRYFST